MKIGQLAKKADIDIQTLRYYESQGIIETPERLNNGYRNYSNKTLQQLSFIKKAKLVGFTLTEIKELLAIQVTADDHTCQEVKAYTGNKLDEINNKIHELTQIKSALEKIHETCCGGIETAEHCSILSALAGEENV